MNILVWSYIIVNLGLYEGKVSRVPVYHAVPVSGLKAMVTADAPICADLGVTILQQGGNAVDALVSTQLCQGVVYPFASGIGGGGFLTVYQKGKAPEFINYREMAPKLANETMFLKNPKLSTLGGLSVGIPGEVKGLELVHQKYGKLSWSKVIDPVVQLAIEGFELPPLLNLRINQYLPAINASEGLKQTYYKNNQIPKNGTIFKNPRLGKTLQAIQQNGSKAFYEGPIAKSLAKAIQSSGGIITEEDLKSYEPYVAEPVNGDFRGYDIFSAPPPGSGAVLVSALNIFENFPSDTPLDSLKAHRLIESMKNAYAFRLNLGDPKFVKSVENVVKLALSKEEAAARAKRINNAITFQPDFYTQVQTEINDHGTAHINILDKDGLAVASTTTVNTAFGSKVLDLETGVLLNNEMDDFSSPGQPNYFNLPHSESNYIKPGKRPQSSMSPTIVTDCEGNVKYLLGASGGSLITSSVFQFLVNLIDEGLSAAETISAARLHHQLIPNEVKYETAWSKEIIEGLKARNHTLVPQNVIASYGGVIVNNTDRIWGAADNRKLSVASGY